MIFKGKQGKNLSLNQERESKVKKKKKEKTKITLAMKKRKRSKEKTKWRKEASEKKSTKKFGPLKEVRKSLKSKNESSINTNELMSKQ